MPNYSLSSIPRPKLEQRYYGDDFLRNKYHDDELIDLELSEHYQWDKKFMKETGNIVPRRMTIEY